MPSVRSRAWELSQPDIDGSQHACGNGAMLAYGRGPDITHIWGPHYTSVNLATMSVCAPAGLGAETSRMPRSAVWRHRLRLAGRDIGTITDLVDAELPCLIRRIEINEGIVFRLRLPPGPPPSASRFAGCTAIVAIHPPGSFEWGGRFRSVDPQSVSVIASGAAAITDRSGDEAAIVCRPGVSTLIVAAGPELPDCLRHARQALDCGWDSLLGRTMQHWSGILGGVRADGGDTLGAAIEDTAVLLTVQQSRDGGLVAGHNFCLGYVRDQYGCSRALLALGLHGRARACLEFYWRIWQQEGRIGNAQSFGPHTRFHVHENDDVEITGWLVQQAFDYLDASGDEDFLRVIAPMLAWAQDRQMRHLVDGMLPFNGDETYIAGSLVPRSVMDDGSAEATLLCIAGGRRLAGWQERTATAPSQAIDALRHGLDRCSGRYRDNFFSGPRLLLNAPERRRQAPLPDFRHGVCQYRGPACNHFGWTERRQDGLYACPACFDGPERPPATPTRHFLPSVAATPVFIGHPVGSSAELGAMLDAAVAPFLGPDGVALPEAGAPGYELGLLLYALARTGDPRSRPIGLHLLSLRDATGAWAEYYHGSRPSHTRYRPWESAINLCGLLAAQEQLETGRVAGQAGHDSLNRLG